MAKDRIPPEKKKRLLEIQTALLDVYIEEADPKNWTSPEKVRAEVTEKVAAGELAGEQAAAELAERLATWKGQRYWEKKNANQTMTMLTGINRFIEQIEGVGPPNAEDERTAVERQIKAAEQQVKKRLARTRPRLVVSNT